MTELSKLKNYSNHQNDQLLNVLSLVRLKTIIISFMHPKLNDFFQVTKWNNFQLSRVQGQN